MAKSHLGFTIVELLIAIVIIGILATISIVAYNGMQDKAKDAVTEIDISSIKKKHTLYVLENSVAPSSLEEFAETGVGGVADKIVWATDRDPGFIPDTITTRGQYYVFMAYGNVLTIYYWNYTEKAWKFHEESLYDGSWNISDGYARRNDPWSDRCSLEILEDCGQQGEY